MPEQGASLRSRLGIVVLLTGIFYLNFLGRVVLAPLMPAIEMDLDIGHGDAGQFFLLISVGYSAALFLSGFLSSRVTHARTIVVSCLVGGAAFLAAAVGRGIPAIYGAFFFAGVASGLYLPSGVSTITAAVSFPHWGRAIAIHEFAPALGYLSAPFVAEFLLHRFSWQAVPAAVGAALILLGVVFACCGKEARFTGQAPTVGNVRSLAAKPAFWSLVALFGLSIGASLGIFSMLPLYLVAERGMDRTVANALLGASRVPVLAFAFFAGWLSDRFGATRTILAVCLTNGATTLLLGILTGGWLWLAIILQPVLTVCFFPAGFTVLSRIVPPDLRSMAVSLNVFLSYLIGAGITPMIIGAFGERGSFATAFVLVGAAMIASAVLVRFLKAPPEDP